MSAIVGPDLDESVASLPRLTEQCLSQIGYCFEHGYPVRVDQFNKLHFSNKRFFSFKKTKLSNQKLALIIAQTVRESNEEYVFEIASHFIQSKALPASDPIFLTLKRSLTAARLGLTSKILEENQGFQEFAEKNQLHRYLQKFDHQLNVDPETKKISILHQNTMTLWDEISGKIRYRHGGWTGHYSKNGIEKISRYDWKNLEPYTTGNPDDWGNQYAFEYVIWHRATPTLTDKPIDEKVRLNGVHTYMRLKTPERKDNIYCVGLYRPDKHTITFNPFRKQDGAFNFFRSLSIRKARLMQPDESEFWEGRFSTLTVAITKNQFLAIKHKIEKDQASKNLIYHVTHDNCNDYVGELGKIAGIDIPSFVPISSLAFSISNEAAAWVPSILRMMATFITTTLVNSIGILCGSTRVNRDVRPNSSPHISSFWDVFNPLKAEFSHPAIFEKNFKKIEGWRRDQIFAHPSKAAEIRFAIPEEYKIPCQTR